MDLKSFVLVACFLIGNACAQDNQSLYTGLNNSDVSSSPNVGYSLNSTDLTTLSRLDVSLQKIIEDAPDNSSIPIPSGSYILSEPLHINKNITLTGSRGKTYQPRQVGRNGDCKTLTHRTSLPSISQTNS